MQPHHIGYLVKTINDTIKTKADKDLKSHNLTLAQSRVLIFLNSQNGIATQKEIEEFLEVSHPTVVGIVSRMEQNGHLTTWIDPANRRNKMVQLTDYARTVGKDMVAVIQAQEQLMLRGLTPKQSQELEQMLWMVYHNLTQ